MHSCLCYTAILLIISSLSNIVLAQKTDSGKYESAPCIVNLGMIKADPCKKKISFPARLNMHQGQLEVIICTAAGKTHESLFISDIDPVLFETSLILIGAVKSEPYAKYRKVPEKLSKLKHKKNKPDLVQLYVEYPLASGTKTVPIEYFIINNQTNAMMAQGLWHFKGIPVDKEGKPHAGMGNNLVVNFLEMDSILELDSPLLFDDVYLFANKDKTSELKDIEINIIVTLKNKK